MNTKSKFKKSNENFMALYFENEIFNSETTIAEILKYSINEVAQFRWKEYQKCWSIRQFLWWEFQQNCTIEQITPLWDRSAKPIKELAIDLILFINLKEKLFSIVLNDAELVKNFHLYRNNLDLYLHAFIEKKWQQLSGNKKPEDKKELKLIYRKL